MRSNAETVEVEVFPAGYGDAILVRCSPGQRSFNILIDGGVRETYGDHLAARLVELSSSQERLDLVVVTHVDTDHIGGVLELLNANGPADAPKVIPIGEIWHNGYRHLGLRGRSATEQEKRSVLSQIPSSGESMMGPGSVSLREAETLASLVTTLGYAWNKCFRGEAVLAGAKAEFRPGMTLTMLSPRTEELARMAYLWKRDLLTKGVSHEAVICPEFEAAFESEMPRVSGDEDVAEGQISYSDFGEVPDPSTFREDVSAINASSIAFVLECAGMRLLFLADAWPSIIVDQWRKHFGEQPLAEVDLIKVSHHASRRNTSPELLETVTSKIFVVSTDGSKHDHPHAEALLRIVASAGPGASLVFNYPSATARKMEEQALRDRYGHTTSVGTGKRSVVLVLGGEGQDVK
jgi:hypothetical protein